MELSQTSERVQSLCWVLVIGKLKKPLWAHSVKDIHIGRECWAEFTAVVNNSFVYFVHPYSLTGVPYYTISHAYVH